MVTFPHPILAQNGLALSQYRTFTESLDLMTEFANWQVPDW